MKRQDLNKFSVEALKSNIITKEDNLVEVVISLFENKPLQEKDILVITSKVVSRSEGRVKKINNEKEYLELIKHEADKVIGGKEVILTLKNGIFIAYAGIDKSNIENGQVVLWPKNPFSSAYKIEKELKKYFKLKNLGVLITDSCCLPLRQGVSGVAIGYSGFKGVKDLRGKSDIYGNKLKVTKQAVADNLATAANFVMGQANEKTPFAIIRGAKVEFTAKKLSNKETYIALKDCIFAPLYTHMLD